VYIARLIEAKADVDRGAFEAVVQNKFALRSLYGAPTRFDL